MAVFFNHDVNGRKEERKGRDGESGGEVKVTFFKKEN